MAEDEKDEERAEKQKERIQEYGDVMIACLDQASRVMELAKMFVHLNAGDREFMRQKIGEALYKTITRRSVIQDLAFSLAAEYGKQLILNKVVEVKLPEPAEKSAGCDHPGLKMLNNLWGVGDQEQGHIAAKHIINAMRIKAHSGDVLLCPHCSRRFAVEDVKSGVLWE